TGATTYKMVLQEDDEFELNYNAATGLITVPDGCALVATVNNADSMFTKLSPSAVITPWTEKAATPQAPYFWNTDEGFYNYGWVSQINMGYGVVQAAFSAHDTDGIYIDPQQMGYRMFIDDADEPYTFTSEDYPDLPEDEMTEIPYYYYDDYINCYTQTLRQIYFMTNIADSIGFQSVYHGGGETRYSDIAWFKPEKTVDSTSPNVSTWQDESTLLYSPAPEGTKQYSWGTHRQENYGIAMALKDEALVGMTVQKVRIPFPADVTGLSNGKMFLTKELKAKKGVNSADISVQSFDIQGGWVEVTLETPYQITDEGLYVGFTFDEDEYVELPLLIVANNEGSGNLYMLGTRTYQHWFDVSANTKYATAMQVVLTSDVSNSASITFEGMDTELGATPKITMTVTNHGSKAIESLDYSWTCGSLSGQKSITLTNKIDAQYGATGTLVLNLPELVDEGNVNLTVTIDKVNGVANPDQSKSHSAILKVYSFLPTYRPLMEEYTGTECGWCPRGLFGLDHMLELYGDDFIAVSYHQYTSKDAMYFTGGTSNSVSGFPSAFFNRNHETDAYFGDGGSGFGVDKVYESLRSSEIAPGDVWAKAYYTSEGYDIMATASTSFPLDEENNHYAFALIVIGNEMSGSDPSWWQTNYYSGRTQYSSDSNLKQYVDMGSYITDQVYNFVALDWTGSSWVSGSLPKKLNANQEYTYTHNFDLSGKKSILADKTKVQVVVALVDTNDGHVVNANKCDVKSYEEYMTGVESVSNASDARIEGYYSLDGKRLSSPQRGVNLIRRADGTTGKVVIR
ncbi:MAG: hypothetical protein K6D37_10885, partial [Prevotella sp.]|nr:hypothetical protein [Prevotella sp.]